MAVLNTAPPAWGTKPSLPAPVAIGIMSISASPQQTIIGLTSSLLDLADCRIGPPEFGISRFELFGKCLDGRNRHPRLRRGHDLFRRSPCRCHEAKPCGTECCAE